MNSRPQTTARAPTIPPSGAHHGMPAIPATVGSGRTNTAAMTRKIGTISPKDTRVASHGLTSDTRRVLFIGPPTAWSTPPAAIKGNSHSVLVDVIDRLLDSRVTGLSHRCRTVIGEQWGGFDRRVSLVRREALMASGTAVFVGTLSASRACRAGSTGLASRCVTMF